jgi:hypothetical protein
MHKVSKFLAGSRANDVKGVVAASIMAASMFAMGASAQANTVSFSGVLTNSPAYHRPSYTNPYTPAFNCSVCGLQSTGIAVGTTGAYTFSIIADNFPDQVNILYAGGFDPTAPFADFVGPYAFATYLAAGQQTTVTLTSGVQYYWVTSTDFGYATDECDLGCRFTTEVTGPGDITVGVPEPTSWALMLAGFGGMGLALRSRRRTVAA